MSDPAVSLDAALKIIEILSILGGGGVVVYKFGRMSEKMEGNLGRLSDKMEAAISSQGANIAALQTDVRELNKLTVSLARYDERIQSVTEQVRLLDARYEELRHGEGFTFPDSPIARAFRTKPPKAE